MSNFTPQTIRDVYQTEKPQVSIEVFPPKTEAGDSNMYQSLDRLQQYGPAFISCTYGAGGSTQDRTAEICHEIQDRYNVTSTAHFTCVGASREQLIQNATFIRYHGVRNFMALRGDPPKGQESFQVAEGGLRYANELVELLRQLDPELGIGVAGYPEKHQEAVDARTDLENLKRKVDAGADAVYTQLFFENDNFFRFRDEYSRIGIEAPLVAGIMPITDFSRIQRITQMCGAYFPPELHRKLEAVQDDKQAQFDIGVEHAVTQCQQLFERGVAGIHFYILNQSSACEQILEALGCRQESATPELALA